MPNPIFQVLGGGNSQSNMMQQFQQFMNQMKGKDPNAMMSGANEREKEILRRAMEQLEKA